ncbi:MAG: HAD domain-containing protein [Capsulimonas sp.]|uniref:HAD domain-containing protein n=1 Tax=Capsulimonas sp. TaxID=2494211 RepID=UPI0032652092
MKLIFLDIDGVLNDRTFHEAAQSSTIKPECVAHFNHLIHETGAVVVLTSSWRYLTMEDGPEYPALMTLAGLRYLLRTHGVTSKLQIIGHTERDCVEHGGKNRGQQIAHYLETCEDVEAYVVLDDNAFDIAECGHPFVQTDGRVGLTVADADRAISLLR